MAQDKLIDLNALSRYKSNYDTLLGAKTNDTSIAPAFSTSASYVIGDVVIYENNLYKFTSAHSAGAWNANDVTATTVEELINSGGGGGGSTISKKRYTITASSWSNSVDANGYYTYTVTLSNPTLDTSYPPNVYLTGANDSTFYTDTEATQYSYLAQCNLTASTTLVLYAKTKPDTTFYVFVEGLEA